MLRQFDINRNGQLTKGEVIGGVRTRFDTIDQNSDGAISELKYLEYRNEPPRPKGRGISLQPQR